MGKEEEAIFIPSPGQGRRVSFLPGRSHFSGSAAGLASPSTPGPGGGEHDPALGIPAPETDHPTGGPGPLES